MPRQGTCCIIALADRPWRRPLWDSICGDSTPSSLCRVGGSKKIRLLEGVLDADFNCRCRIEMVTYLSLGGVA